MHQASGSRVAPAVPVLDDWAQTEANSLKTIQEVFLHTIYQGLGTKHVDLQQRLTSRTSNNLVTDEEILHQVFKIINEENEHQRRLGQTPRQKTTQVHSAKVETGDCHNIDKSRDTAAENKSLKTI